jgi:ADP-ribose pyrophosphatase
VTPADATEPAEATHARLRDVEEAWPVVSSQTRFEGRIVTAYTDTIQGPDGEQFDREVVRHNGAVAVVAADEHDRIFVLTQFRHPVAQRLVELPAGLLDVDGEDPLDAAKRELAEEAGLHAERWSVLVDLLTSPGILDERVRIYLAEGLSETAAPDGFEAAHEEADMGRHWTPLADVVAGILAGEVKDGLTVSGSLALWARRHENPIG